MGRRGVSARSGPRAGGRSRRARRPRVLMLGWEFPPRISGGLGTACRGLTLGLARLGVDVVFVLPRAEGDEDGGPVRILGSAAEEPAGSSRDDADDDADGAGAGDAVTTRPLPGPHRPYDGAAGWRPSRAGPAPGEPFGVELPAAVERYVSTVAALAAGEEFDLVHGHDWMTFPAAAAVARERGVPLLLHVHSTERDRSGPRAHPGIRSIEQRGLEVADRVVCVSRYTADRVRRDYGVDPGRIAVVHNAALHEGDPVPPVRARHFPEPVVLFLGRVTYQKGPAFFLEAAALVARRHRTARFVVAGEGDLLPSMIERAAELGLARRMHFTGFLGGEERERAFAAADVYVMPSVSEPFGIAALEAMARGVPTVISRQSGAAEVLEHVLRSDYWDVEDLAGNILSVLRDPRLRERLSGDGRAEAGRWRWERQAAVLRDVYAGLLE